MSDRETETMVLVVIEGPLTKAWDAFVRFAFVAAVIGAGWALDSAAMQWIGFLSVVITAVAAAVQQHKTRVTPQEAADRLLRECGVTGRRD